MQRRLKQAALNPSSKFTNSRRKDLIHNFYESNVIALTRKKKNFTSHKRIEFSDENLKFWVLHNYVKLPS